MMTIGSVTGTNNNMQAGGSGINMQTDSVSKNIQNQIANAQKQLQELSSNEDMTLEEKMKKRQEIQQEITTLNQQLRQHQIEQRKEQQSKGASMDDMLGGNRTAAKSGNKGNGLSQASMQAMISADSSMKQAKVQGSMATQMEGKAGVLESEIKMDKGRGASTEKKEEELADLQAKAQSATAAQISTLADAGKVMEEAVKADQAAEPVENKNSKTDKNAENDDININGKEAEENVSGAESVNTQANISVSEGTQATSSTVVQQPTVHTSIDIRL